MRTTKLVTIYLEDSEINEAILQWIKRKHPKSYLVKHLEQNLFSLDWSGGGYLLSVDGEIDDNVF